MSISNSTLAGISEMLYTKDFLKNWGDTVSVGEYTYGNPEILHWGELAKLTIGKFCSFGDRVVIFLGGNHRSDWITTYPFPDSLISTEWPGASSIRGHPATKGDVYVGNDVWIGYGATILSGTRIDDGAIIGARAVVSHDVSPYSVVVGNPAKPVKKRFSDDQITELLRIKWWNWSIEKIRMNLHVLCSSNVEALKRLSDY